MPRRLANDLFSTLAQGRLALCSAIPGYSVGWTGETWGPLAMRDGMTGRGTQVEWRKVQWRELPGSLATLRRHERGRR